MAVTIDITLNFEWLKEPANCKKCGVCDDIMVTDVNKLYLFFNNQLAQDEPMLTVCNSCCNIIEL